MGKRIDYVGSRQEWQTHLQSFNSGNLKVADGISLVKEIVKTHLATLPCPFWERFCPRIKETIEYIRIVCDLKSCCFVFERKCSSWSGKFQQILQSVRKLTSAASKISDTEIISLYWNLYGKLDSFFLESSIKSMAGNDTIKTIFRRESNWLKNATIVVHPIMKVFKTSMESVMERLISTC